MKEEAAIKRRFELVAGELNERSRRLVAASEAVAIGWGGVSAVSRATELSRKAISHGIQELQERGEPGGGRIRRKGGGRKTTVSKDPRLRQELERLVEPVTRGDPESPLALDVQEPAQARSGIEEARPPGVPSIGQRVAPRTGL